jgi:hypothetical protein
MFKLNPLGHFLLESGLHLSEEWVNKQSLSGTSCCALTLLPVVVVATANINIMQRLGFYSTYYLILTTCRNTFYCWRSIVERQGCLQDQQLWWVNRQPANNRKVMNSCEGLLLTVDWAIYYKEIAETNEAGIIPLCILLLAAAASAKFRNKGKEEIFASNLANKPTQ